MEAQKIIERVKKDGMEFISLQFTDLQGVIKEDVIPVDLLSDAITSGIWFDGSSIEGFARIQESDLFLKPDLATYAVVPWLTENGKTARFICNIYRPDGKPFEGDPRTILGKAIAKAAKLGFQYNVGPEPEFYLFKNDGDIKNNPMDYGGYFDLSSHKGYGVMRDISAALKKMGISVETSHHEVGQGQYEIDFRYGHALEIADKLLTLKYVVKKIAQMHDLHATFMPKPIKGAAGTGMHIHQSLFDLNDEKNLFYDSHDKLNLSKTAYSFIAGQIKYIKEMCAILCPTVNSYKRLVSGFEAPVYVTWASMNRSALIRVPQWFKEKPKSARIELRCPDPTCNPYLAFAVLLEAGLDGVANNLTPPAPVEEDVYQFNLEGLTDKGIETLPTSLWESLEEMKRSPLIKSVLGPHLFEKYAAIKTREWNEFKIEVTSWELNKYLDLF